MLILNIIVSVINIVLFLKTIYTHYNSKIENEIKLIGPLVRSDESFSFAVNLFQTYDFSFIRKDVLETYEKENRGRPISKYNDIIQSFLAYQYRILILKAQIITVNNMADLTANIINNNTNISHSFDGIKDDVNNLYDELLHLYIELNIKFNYPFIAMLPKKSKKYKKYYNKIGNSLVCRFKNRK